MATACIALLSLPGAALAARGTVPPGVSGAAQYTESLPGAGGEESTKAMVEAGQGGKGDGGGADGEAAEPARTLGAENAEKLEALGPEGKAAAGLAAAGGGDKGPGGGGSGGGGGETAAQSSGGSGVGQVVGQLSGSEGSSGMGLLLPLLIAMAVVASAGYLIGRRRVITHDQH